MCELCSNRVEGGTVFLPYATVGGPGLVPEYAQLHSSSGLAGPTRFWSLAFVTNRSVCARRKGW
jgi:hypothetical protein